MMKEVRWLRSAAKHGVKREDAVYAMENAIRADANFSAASSPTDGVVMLMIGPNRQGSAFLEILFEVRPDQGIIIFHAMKLRSSTVAQTGSQRPQ